MIDFRYHLVSIIAIFLALAIGIVVGTTALNGTVLDNVQSEVQRLSSDKAAQRQQIDGLTSQSEAQLAFIARVEPSLETGVLPGQRVALVTAAGVPTATRSGVITALHRAAAILTADVRLSGSFTDATKATTLDDLATRLVLPVSGLPAKATGPQLAAAELAAVLVTKPGSRPIGTDTIQTTLAGFQQGGFLTVAGTPGAQATLAVVLVPKAPATVDEATTLTTTVLTDLANRLGSRSTGTLVAGPAAATEPGGTLAAVRTGKGPGTVSSVDTVDLAAGRVSLVLALRNAVAGKRGDFGFAPGASGPLPARSASPSPATSPSR